MHVIESFKNKFPSLFIKLFSLSIEVIYHKKLIMIIYGLCQGNDCSIRLGHIFVKDKIVIRLGRILIIYSKITLETVRYAFKELQQNCKNSFNLVLRYMKELH